MDATPSSSTVTNPRMTTSPLGGIILYAPRACPLAARIMLAPRRLRLVAAVSGLGRLTRAGRVLHRTQSCLSRRKRELETRLGLPLLHGLGNRMVRSPA